MEIHTECLNMEVKEEPLEDQACSSLQLSSSQHTSRVDSFREASGNNCIVEGLHGEPLKVKVEEKLMENQVSPTLIGSSQQASVMDSVRGCTEEVFHCDVAEVKKEDVSVKDEPLEDHDNLSSSTTAFCPAIRSRSRGTRGCTEEVFHCDMAEVKKEDVSVKDEPLEDHDNLSSRTTAFCPEISSRSRGTKTISDTPERPSVSVCSPSGCRRLPEATGGPCMKRKMAHRTPHHTSKKLLSLMLAEVADIKYKANLVLRQESQEHVKKSETQVCGEYVTAVLDGIDDDVQRREKICEVIKFMHC